MANLNNKSLLIVKFPYESAWGGEEEIHLLLAQKLKNVALLTSCPYLFEAFKKHNFYAKKFWFRGTDPVSIKSILFFFPFTGLVLFFTGFFWLLFFRIKGFEQVLFLRFQEKILWTPIARLFGMKVFWGEHVGFGRWLYKNPFLFLYKFWAKFVTFIVPSGEMQRQVKEVVKTANIQVLPNALAAGKDLFLEKKDPKKLTDFLNQKFNLKFSKEDIFVGFTGRLSREKGLFFLLEVAEKVVKKNPQIRFLIAGDGTLKNLVAKKIVEKKLNNNVLLLGFLNTEELKKIYLGIKVFCLFSDHETFGIAILEAMSAGVPVCATEVGAIPEIISDGINGFLIKKGDTNNATEKILKIAQDKNLAQKLGNNSKKIFQKKYYVEIFGNKAKKIFFDQ